MNRSHFLHGVVCLVLTAIGLTGCSGIPRQQRDHEQLERYLSYAGPPVDHFTWLGHYYGWQYLAETQSQYQLVLWTTPSDAYLLTVRSPCEELPFVEHIGLTSTGSTVSAYLDNVLVHRWRCQISQIRPVDYRRMEQDLRAAREAAKAQKQSDPNAK